jgi:thiosulfate/3-mercaptopyruvate sulfurtransferase
LNNEAKNPIPPLVSTDWLLDHLDDPDIRIFDCSTYLARDPETTFREVTGESDWWKEHIPGAGFLNIPEALSDKTSSLRLTMLPPDEFARRMAAYGVSEDTRVVLYAAGQIMWATRVWWMLRAIGFDNAAVLDGGFQKWKQEDKPVSNAPCLYTPGTLTARPRPEAFCDRREVLSAIDAPGCIIVNALPPDQHRGESDVSHGRRGRIASSININAFDLIKQPGGTFHGTEDLRSLFEEAGIGKEDRVLCYCGGGISATGDAFALLMAGYDNVSVYDGSMNEWAKDPDLPMETG